MLLSLENREKRRGLSSSFTFSLMTRFSNLPTSSLGVSRWSLDDDKNSLGNLTFEVVDLANVNGCFSNFYFP